MVDITFYGDINEAGGNKTLLEDGFSGRNLVHRCLFDWDGCRLSDWSVIKSQSKKEKGDKHLQIVSGT